MKLELLNQLVGSIFTSTIYSEIPSGDDPIRMMYEETARDFALKLKVYLKDINQRNTSHPDHELSTDEFCGLLKIIHSVAGHGTVKTFYDDYRSFRNALKKEPLFLAYLELATYQVDPDDRGYYSDNFNLYSDDKIKLIADYPDPVLAAKLMWYLFNNGDPKLDRFNISMQHTDPFSMAKGLYILKFGYDFIPLSLNYSKFNIDLDKPEFKAVLLQNNNPEAAAIMLNALAKCNGLTQENIELVAKNQNLEDLRPGLSRLYTQEILSSENMHDLLAPTTNKKGVKNILAGLLNFSFLRANNPPQAPNSDLDKTSMLRH